METQRIRFWLILLADSLSLPAEFYVFVLDLLFQILLDLVSFSLLKKSVHNSHAIYNMIRCLKKRDYYLMASIPAVKAVYSHNL